MTPLTPEELAACREAIEQFQSHDDWRYADKEARDKWMFAAGLSYARAESAKEIAELRHQANVLIAKGIDAAACIASLKAQVEALRNKYNDLLYCVSKKYPGESRHDTAKRYLLDREKPSVGATNGAAIAQETSK